MGGRTPQRMTLAAARRITRRSRSYGWFRPSLVVPAGYRPCPVCGVRIGGEARGVAGDGRVAAAVNRAIDEAMVEHLVDPDSECLAR